LQSKDGDLVQTSQQVKTGDRLTARLASGHLDLDVNKSYVSEK